MNRISDKVLEWIRNYGKIEIKLYKLQLTKMKTSQWHQTANAISPRRQQATDKRTDKQKDIAMMTLLLRREFHHHHHRHV